MFGNPDLDLETADNFELSYRYDGAALVLDAVAFYTKSRNYIATLKCGTAGTGCPEDIPRGTPNRIYAYVDEAAAYGVELLAEYSIAGTGISPYVSGAWTRRRLEFENLSTLEHQRPRAGRATRRPLRAAHRWRQRLGEAVPACVHRGRRDP